MMDRVRVILRPHQTPNFEYGPLYVLFMLEDADGIECDSIIIRNNGTYSIGLPNPSPSYREVLEKYGRIETVLSPTF